MLTVVFGQIDVGTPELVDGKDVLYLSVTDEGPDSHERLHHDINPTKTNTSCDYWRFIQSAVVFRSIFSDSFLQSVFLSLESGELSLARLITYSLDSSFYLLVGLPFVC